MKTGLLYFICALFLLWSCKEADIEVREYQVVPFPQEIVYNKGLHKLKSNVKIAFPSALKNEASFLAAYLSDEFSVRAELKEGSGKGDVILMLKEEPDSDAGKYTLQVKKKQIIIEGNSASAVFYGVQTLRQLIFSEKDQLAIQTGAITDYPAFNWRAFMLDEGRYFKGKDVVFRLMDEMARLKMNVFHWHLTNDQGWRIEIKKYPLLTEVGAFRDSSEINHFHSNVFDGKPHGGFYTQEEIKEVLAYAAERHIMVVPEISMPGHVSAAIAAYPRLGASGKQIKVSCYFGVMYDVLNVADPNVLSFLEDVLDEVIGLFPAPVIHIGGDEVRYNEWKDSKMIQAYMKSHNLKTPAELQVFFTNEISKLLASKNRQMMGWNEITGAKLHEYQAEDDANSATALAPGTIVHFWKGDPVLISQTIEKGYSVVNSYHEYTYIDYSYKSIPLEKAYGFSPIPEGLTPEMEKKVLGLGCQMWGEFIPTEADMNKKVYPRIAAYAETGWIAPEKKDYNRFLGNLDRILKKWMELGFYESAE